MSNTNLGKLPNWIEDYKKLYEGFDPKLQQQSQIQDKIFCCEKFRHFINDLEEKGEYLKLDKFGKVLFVWTAYCGEEDETRYPYYDFEYCPFCRNKIN